MSEQFNVTVNLSTCNCSVCGIVYTLPCNMREARTRDHETFYCPNGHKQYCPGKSDEEELEEKNTGLQEENIELSEEVIKLEKRVKYYKNKANKEAK